MRFHHFIQHFFLLSLMCLALSACQKDSANKESIQAKIPDPNPFPSTYIAPKHKRFAIINANVLTGDGKELSNTSLLIEDGKIKSIGQALNDENIVTIDAKGKWVTPGLIDVHSHMGVYSAPATENHADGNEMTNPVTAEVWAEHSIWTQDPQFEKSIAGGVTTLQVLPGSGNLVGGRGVTLKNIPSLSVQGMKFPGAPYSLKMACGENPRRVYGQKGKAPSTRMGNMAGYRKAWIDAQEYKDKWDEYLTKTESGDADAKPPKRDLRLETLKGVLEGKIRVHNHCYRADEMMHMVDLAKEFGYQIAAFHHAVEAYKIAPDLADNKICSAVWADWWGFKQEAADMVLENLALLEYAGACAVIHSDDPIGIQHLNQEIAKAMTSGKRLGINITRAKAIQWATLNPAISLGLDHLIGSITEGKNADLVMWSDDPFSIYSQAEKVWIDGALRFDIQDPSVRPTSDFNLGLDIQDKQ